MALADRLLALVAAIGADISALFGRAMPAGGATGQVLTKSGSADFQVAWTSPSSGGVVIKAHAQAIGYPAKTSGSFVVADNDISAASKLRIRLGNFGDEAEFMPGLTLSASPAAGQMTVYWACISPLGGTLNIDYEVI